MSSDSVGSDGWPWAPGEEDWPGNIVMIKEEKIISEYGKLKGGYRHNLGSLCLTERVVILGLKIYLLIGKNLKVKLI